MSLFFKKSAVLWFSDSHVKLGLNLKKKEAMTIKETREMTLLPEGISQCVGIMPSDEVMSAVIDLPGELEGDLIEAHVKQNFSEWLPVEVAEAHYEWKVFSEVEKGMKRCSLVGVSTSAIKAHQMRIGKEACKNQLWTPEAVAMMMGLRDQLDLSDTMIVAARIDEQWLLIGICKGMVIDDIRTNDFNDFDDFYTAFTQQTGIFPSKFVTVAEGDWPDGFTIQSVINTPEQAILPINEADLVARTMEGAQVLIDKVKKSGFLLCPQIDLG